MDIFDSNIELPESVTILAPGPGAADWERGEDEYVIAVNAAVNIGPCDWWTVADMRAVEVELDWFERGYLPARDGMNYLFSRDIKKLLFGKDEYSNVFSFRQGLALSPNDVRLQRSYLRWNATIVGQDLQFCYWFGVKHVKLVGVDMRGDSYWDGTVIPEYADRDVWPYVDTLNALIAELVSRGMTITAETPTALSIP
jgi:hypothetical protein